MSFPLPDTPFFKFLQSSDSEERALAALVMGRVFVNEELDEFGREELVRGLTAVLDDPDPKVRRTLSEVLVEAENPPIHVVHFLCRDQLEVARPFLEDFSGLPESDLVDLVGEGTDAVRSVIAGRDNLTASVAAALGEVGTRDTCLRLVENLSAPIADVTFVKLAERFSEDSEVRAALLERNELPLDVRHELVSALSDALGSLVVGREWMAPGKAALVMREACEKATVEFTETADDGEQKALIGHLSARGKLTPGLLIRAMAAGNLNFVVEALSLLSALPAKRVEKLVSDRRASVLYALFSNAGLPKVVHDGFLFSIRTVIESRKEGLDMISKTGRRRLVERMLTQYQEFAPEDLGYLLGLLTRLSGEAARAEAREMMEPRDNDEEVDVQVAA